MDGLEKLDDKARRDIAYLEQFIEDAKRAAQVAIIGARAQEIDDLAEAMAKNPDPFEFVNVVVAYIQRRRQELAGMVLQLEDQDKRRAAARQGGTV